MSSIRHSMPLVARDGSTIMDVSNKRSREEAEQLVGKSLPGDEVNRLVAGNLEDPRVGAYVAAVSYLEGSWYVSLLQLYDTSQATRSIPDESRAVIPRQFPGVPPTPEGVAVRFRREYDDPLEAGATYGFLQTSLLEEGKEPDEQLVGLQKLERWIANCEQGQIFERLYSNPELAEDPHYRAELERQIQALVPDPEEREALHSLYASRYSQRE